MFSTRYMLKSEAIADDWWEKLTREEQQAYLTAHPKSKFHVDAPQKMSKKKVVVPSIDLDVPENGEYIVYHGTGNKIDQFQESFVRPHFFTPDENYAKGYTGGKIQSNVFFKQSKRKNYIIKARVTIKHICDTKNDPEALKFYNEKFIPSINAINVKYNKPLVPELKPGERISFINADDFWRYCQSRGSPYDGMKVAEGGGTKQPAIVPFKANQIEVLNHRILKNEEM